MEIFGSEPHLADNQGKDKVIPVTCQGADKLPIGSLSAFQGNLKSLSEKEYLKLKQSILSVGFSFPVFVWRDNGENYIIDGHQRLFVVQKMIEEGWELEGGLIPVDWIEAKDKKEAKEKVLLAASQYGKMDAESLYEFIETEGLEFPDLEMKIDLPQIDLEKFKFGYYEDKEPAFIDQDEMMNKFSIVIKCLNEEEQKTVMAMLKLPKPKIYFKDFIEAYEEGGGRTDE